MNAAGLPVGPGALSTQGTRSITVQSNPEEI